MLRRIAVKMGISDMELRLLKAGRQLDPEAPCALLRGETVHVAGRLDGGGDQSVIRSTSFESRGRVVASGASEGDASEALQQEEASSEEIDDETDDASGEGSARRLKNCPAASHALIDGEAGHSSDSCDEVASEDDEEGSLNDFVVADEEASASNYESDEAPPSSGIDELRHVAKRVCKALRRQLLSAISARRVSTLSALAQQLNDAATAEAAAISAKAELPDGGSPVVSPHTHRGTAAAEDGGGEVPNEVGDEEGGDELREAEGEEGDEEGGHAEGQGEAHVDDNGGCDANGEAAAKPWAPSNTQELLHAIATADYGVVEDRSPKLATPAMKAYNSTVVNGEKVEHKRGQPLPLGFKIVKVSIAPASCAPHACRAHSSKGLLTNWTFRPPLADFAPR